ncbi:MAG: hypothetical protein EON88_10065, partial [Brevundimonas sp.]
MNPLIMIPARMAATRLPNKPLALIGDTPMIVRAYRQAEASGLPVVVAAGDPEIVEAVEAAGGRAILTEPEGRLGSVRMARPPAASTASTISASPAATTTGRPEAS